MRSISESTLRDIKIDILPRQTLTRGDLAHLPNALNQRNPALLSITWSLTCRHANSKRQLSAHAMRNTDLLGKQLTQITEQSYKPNPLLESKTARRIASSFPLIYWQQSWKFYKHKPRDTQEYLCPILTLRSASPVHSKPQRRNT